MGLLSKAIQTSVRFGLSDRLEVHLDHFRMPAGNGRLVEKTIGRSLDVMSDMKKNIVFVKAALFLTH